MNIITDTNGYLIEQNNIIYHNFTNAVTKYSQLKISHDELEQALYVLFAEEYEVSIDKISKEHLIEFEEWIQKYIEKYNYNPLM